MKKSKVKLVDMMKGEVNIKSIEDFADWGQAEKDFQSGMAVLGASASATILNEGSGNLTDVVRKAVERLPQKARQGLLAVVKTEHNLIMLALTVANSVRATLEIGMRHNETKELGGLLRGIFEATKAKEQDGPTTTTTETKTLLN